MNQRWDDGLRRSHGVLRLLPESTILLCQCPVKQEMHPFTETRRWVCEVNLQAIVQSKQRLSEEMQIYILLCSATFIFKVQLHF